MKIKNEIAFLKIDLHADNVFLCLEFDFKKNKCNENIFWYEILFSFKWLDVEFLVLFREGDGHSQDNLNIFQQKLFLINFEISHVSHEQHDMLIWKHAEISVDWNVDGS
jgi:hypothetical protein